MRKVSLDKYKYSIKDFFRWIAIIISHYAAFIFLLFIILAFRFIVEDNFFPTETQLPLFFYPILVGPFVNAMAHIIYAERGMTNIKAVLWIHSFVALMWIIVITFVI